MAALAKQLRAATDHEDVDLGGYGQVRRVLVLTQQARNTEWVTNV